MAFDPRDPRSYPPYPGFRGPQSPAFSPAFPVPRQVPFPSRFPLSPYQQEAEGATPAPAFGITGARIVRSTYTLTEYTCRACHGIFSEKVNDGLAACSVMTIAGERVCKSCHWDHSLMLLEFRLALLESQADRDALREELLTTGRESKRTFEGNTSHEEFKATFAHLKDRSLAPDDQSCYERFLAHRLGVDQADLLRASKSRPPLPRRTENAHGSRQPEASREHDRERDRAPTTPPNESADKRFSAVATDVLQSRVAPSWREHSELMKTEEYYAMFFELATRYISDRHNLSPDDFEAIYPSYFMRSLIESQLRCYTVKEQPQIRYAPRKIVVEFHK